MLIKLTGDKTREGTIQSRLWLASRRNPANAQIYVIARRLVVKL